MNSARRFAVVAGVAGLALGFAALPADAASTTYSDPVAGPQSFVVPAGVCSITVDATGAQGGLEAFSSADGGPGGRTVATIPVTPGETLQIDVGGRGGDGEGASDDSVSADNVVDGAVSAAAVFAGGAGGINGGGAGGSSSDGGGGGGGGASDVRQAAGGSGCVPCPAPGTASTGTGLADRVVVAGGGGGVATFSSGGAGTGGAGGGASGATPDGDGGNGDAQAPAVAAVGGKAGTTSAGGAGGMGSTDGINDETAGSGSDGISGTGGAGGGLLDANGGGGGGGGGYFGGGGGGGVTSGEGSAGGGGGGSSFAAADATGVTFTPGVGMGDGAVTLSWTVTSDSTPGVGCAPATPPANPAPANAVAAKPSFTG
jgi:hypothetical protein